MSLEESVENLVTVMTRLAVAIERSHPVFEKGDITSTPVNIPAKKAEKRAPQPVTSPIAAVPVSVAASPEAAPVMEFAEAQSRLAQAAQRLGSPTKVIEVMSFFNGPPLTSIDPSKYAEVVAAAEALK